LVFLCKRPLEDKINSSKGIIKIGVGEEFTKELSCKSQFQRAVFNKIRSRFQALEQGEC
jgi:hypothetical protein